MSWWQKYFLGAKSRSAAAVATSVGDLRLYYRLEEDLLAVSLPLELVYRDCDGNVFHLPVESRNGRWQLGWQDSVSFPRLDRLLEHYENGLLLHNGRHTCWESFSIWSKEFQEQFGT